MGRLDTKIHKQVVCTVAFLALFCSAGHAQDSAPPANIKEFIELSWSYINAQNQIVADVTSKTARIENDTLMSLKDPVVFFYDLSPGAKPQQTLAQCTAKSGTLDKSKEELVMRGSVSAVNSQGATLDCEELYTSLSARALRTEGRFVITYGRIRLSGTGFSGDADLKKIIVKKDPLARLPGPFNADILLPFQGGAVPELFSAETLAINSDGELEVISMPVDESGAEKTFLAFNDDVTLHYDSGESGITVVKASRLEMKLHLAKAGTDAETLVMDYMLAGGNAMLVSAMMEAHADKIIYDVSKEQFVTCYGNPVVISSVQNGISAVCTSDAAMTRVQVPGNLQQTIMTFNGSVRFQNAEMDLYGDTVKLNLGPTAQGGSDSLQEINAYGNCVLLRNSGKDGRAITAESSIVRIDVRAGKTELNGNNPSAMLAIDDTVIRAETVSLDSNSGLLVAERNASVSVSGDNAFFGPKEGASGAGYVIKADKFIISTSSSAGALPAINAYNNVGIDKGPEHIADADGLTRENGTTLLTGKPGATMFSAGRKVTAEKIFLYPDKDKIRLEGKKSIIVTGADAETLNAVSEGPAELVDGGKLLVMDRNVVLSRGNVRLSGNHVELAVDVVNNRIDNAYCKDAVTVISPNGTINGNELVWEFGGGVLDVKGTPYAKIELQNSVFQAEHLLLEGYSQDGTWQKITAVNTNKKGYLRGKAKAQ